jgi:hypothetical protein
MNDIFFMDMRSCWKLEEAQPPERLGESAKSAPMPPKSVEAIVFAGHSRFRAADLQTSRPQIHQTCEIEFTGPANNFAVSMNSVTFLVTWLHF